MRWPAITVALIVAAGCSEESGADLRTFDLRGQVPVNGSQPRAAPELPSQWQSVEALVLEAPESVAAGSDFEFTIELRNPLTEAITLDPCPVWSAGFGESSEATALDGLLPCDEIGRLEPGERVRLRLEMPAPPNRTEGEGGEFAGLGWGLNGEFSQDVNAHIAIPMTDDG